MFYSLYTHYTTHTIREESNEIKWIVDEGLALAFPCFLLLVCCVFELHLITNEIFDLQQLYLQSFMNSLSLLYHHTHLYIFNRN